jgi:hypothetical protein
MRGVGKGFIGQGRGWREKGRESQEDNGECALIAGGDHFVG